MWQGPCWGQAQGRASQDTATGFVLFRLHTQPWLSSSFVASPTASASPSPVVPMSLQKLWTLPHFQWPLPSDTVMRHTTVLLTPACTHDTFSPQNHLLKEVTTRFGDRGPRLIFHTALALVMVNYQPTFL